MLELRYENATMQTILVFWDDSEIAFDNAKRVCIVQNVFLEDSYMNRIEYE